MAGRCHWRRALGSARGRAPRAGRRGGRLGAAGRTSGSGARSGGGCQSWEGAPSSWGWQTLERSPLGLPGFSQGGERELGVLAVKLGASWAGPRAVVILPADPASRGVREGAGVLEPFEGFPLLAGAGALPGVRVVGGESPVERGVRPRAARVGVEGRPRPTEGPLEFDQAAGEFAPREGARPQVRARDEQDGADPLKQGVYDEVLVRLDVYVAELALKPSDVGRDGFVV